MIKNISKRKLNRPSSHRNATLRNLACNLIRYGSIKTTKPKAKELKRLFEHLITKIKNTNEIFNKYRIANKYLYEKSLSEKLINIIIPKYNDIKCGYIKTAFLKNRKGDNAKIYLVRLR